MTRKSFEKKIISLLPSKTLKENIKQTAHKFNDEDILKIIEDYSGCFKQKLDLLFLASQIFTDKNSVKHTKKLIEYNKKQYDEFVKDDDNSVYYVEIKCSPNEGEDNYIVKTYEGVLKLISNFLKRFKGVGSGDNINSRYTITKWTSKSPDKPREMDKLGRLGVCVLGYKQEVLSVDYYFDFNEYGLNCGFNRECNECKYDCVNTHILNLPLFLHKYDLVSFIPHWQDYFIDAGEASVHLENNGQLIYGILGADMRDDPDDDCAYIILLDSSYIKNRQAMQKDKGYYLIYCHHDHVPYPEVEKISPGEVTNEIAEDYLYAVEQLKIIEKDE